MSQCYGTFVNHLVTNVSMVGARRVESHGSQVSPRRYLPLGYVVDEDPSIIELPDAGHCATTMTGSASPRPAVPPTSVQVLSFAIPCSQTARLRRRPATGGRPPD